MAEQSEAERSEQAAGLRERRADEPFFALEFNYRRDDLVEAYRAHFAVRGRPARLMLVASLAAVVAAVGVVSGQVLLAALFAVCLVFAWRSSLRTAAARLYDRERVFREQVSLTADDHGVEGRLSDSWYTCRWSRFEKVVESDSVFLLYSQMTQFVVVPKRLFATDQELDAFRELLRRNVKLERV